MLGFFYGDIVAWRVHLGFVTFVRTSPAGGESAKEMSSTRLRRRRRSLRRHQPLQRQQPGRMVAALPTSLPQLWQPMACHV